MKRYIVTATLLILAVACAEKPISQLPPEEGMTRIRVSLNDQNWERVINDVNEYRSRYPYTQYAPEAELAQADAYFQSGRYPEAVATYEEFLRKNPKHGQAAFCAYRIALAYDAEAPEEADREQDFAQKAIEKYRASLQNFPKSEWATEASKRMETLKRRVAEHFVFVARYYWKKDIYQGALMRYLQVINQYGDFKDLKEEAINRAALCYRELAATLEKDPKSDKVVFYRSSTPSELRKHAEALEAQLPKGTN